MDLLPDELLLLIFEMLPINETISLCPRVCRRWKNLLHSRSLVIRDMYDTHRLKRSLHEVQVRGPLDPLPFKLFIERLVYYSPQLRSLTVSRKYYFHSWEFKNLAKCPNLEHLDIFSGSFLFLRRKTGLDVFKMKSIVFNTDISANMILELPENTQLTDIHMYGYAKYCDTKLLQTVLQLRAEHLRDLTLRCSKMVSDDYKLIGKCLNLTSLRLYSCWLMKSQEILYITKPSKLHTLHVTDTKSVERYALKEFLENLQQSVKELVLSGSCFGDYHIPFLHNRNSSLHVLELWRTNVTSSGIVSLAFSLPLLNVLDLDLELSTYQVQTLQTHPSLRTLRCFSEMFKSLKNNEGCNQDQYKEQGVDNDVQFPAIYNIRETISYDKITFRSKHSQFFQYYFRKGLVGSDGFRGSLFYFRTRHKMITPFNSYFNIPPITPP